MCRPGVEEVAGKSGSGRKLPKGEGGAHAELEKTVRFDEGILGPGAPKGRYKVGPVPAESVA